MWIPRFKFRTLSTILVLFSICGLVLSTSEEQRLYNSSDYKGWSSWEGWTPCSQSCGSGISRQQRHCRSTHCTGSRTRYRSCNSQACPSSPPNLRSQQCSSFNAKDSRGRWVTWKSVNPPPDEEQCQLVCKSVIGGHPHYVRSQVIDGTKCRGFQGVCLDGRCVTLGCDGVVGSAMSEDGCHRCIQVNNATALCRHFVGQTYLPRAQKALYTIVRIPSGASYLNVTAVGSARTRIKVATMEGQHTVFESGSPSEMPLAGTQFSLINLQSCPYCLEKWSLLANGPTSSVFDILVQNPESDIAVLFSYNMVEGDHHRQGRTRKKRFIGFRWSLKTSQSFCSVTCGNGTRVTTYECQYSYGQKYFNVPDYYCLKTMPRPSPLVEICEQPSCQTEWVTGTWGDCSQACGRAYHTRVVHCEKRISEVERIRVNNTFCSHLPFPSVKEECPVRPCVAMWLPGIWLEECQGPCGVGLGVQRRLVKCYNASGNLVNDSECSRSSRPLDRRRCTRNCTSGVWRTFSWSKCHGSCGKGGGVKTRVVHCVLPGEGKYTVTIDDNCPLPRPATREVCDIRCTWQVGEWNACSQSCGSGVQTRAVQCTNINGLNALGCPDPMPPQQKPCNTQACLTCRGEQFSESICQFWDTAHGYCLKVRNSLSTNWCCQYCSGVLQS